jgi:hypothetical protein
VVRFNGFSSIVNPATVIKSAPISLKIPSSSAPDASVEDAVIWNKRSPTASLIRTLIGILFEV